MLPEREAYRLFCYPGIPKGLAPWHTPAFGTKCPELVDCLLAKAGGTVNGGAVCAVHLDR